MERLHRHQLLEQSIYGAIWILIFLLPLIGGYFAVSNGIERDEIRVVVCESWLHILPFLILFLLNNYALMPSFFFKRKYGSYTVSLVFIICLFSWNVLVPSGAYFSKDFRRNPIHYTQSESRRDQIIKMREKGQEEGIEHDEHWNKHQSQQKSSADRFQRSGAFPKPVPFPFPPFAIRYLIHIAIAFLMIGFNIAIKLLFKSFRDEEVMKELEHERLQSELKYLKYQINPHFFMNTLNNIHALVDIDTEKAKGTLVELSKLMRYVLYEASHKTILLSREIQFLENYIALMGLRYIDKVFIKTDFPIEIPEVQIPPLLFVSFIENAFKHGVSYRNESFIHVSVQLEEGNRISFRCANSNHGSSDQQHHGIGLENIRKRLRLLFGNDYTLSIKEEEQKFDVLLMIPLL